MQYFRFEITPDKARQLVRITATGPLSREGFIQMVTEARQQAHQLQWNLLYDMRHMYLPDEVLLSEILGFLKSSSLNSPQAKRLRSASLVVDELLSEEIWDIYRYASGALGLHWAFFTSEQAAIDWLGATDTVGEQIGQCDVNRANQIQ